MNLDPYYVKDKLYSITLNPTDKYQYFGKIGRFKLFRSFIFQEIQHWSQMGIDYELYIEISEPRGMKVPPYRGPRLHLHGYINFKTISSIGYFLSLGYYKLLKFTSVDIDTIADPKAWLSYCKKQHLFKNNRLSNLDQ